MTDGSILLDSNVFVYAFDKSEPKKYSIAKSMISKCLQGKAKYTVSIQNLSEFYNVVTTKIEKPMEPDNAEKIIHRVAFFEGFIKISPNLVSVLTAVKFSYKFKVHYWDCLIAATMLQNNIYKIYTENLKDFSKIPGIIAENPFD